MSERKVYHIAAADIHVFPIGFCTLVEKLGFFRYDHAAAPLIHYYFAVAEGGDIEILDILRYNDFIYPAFRKSILFHAFDIIGQNKQSFKRRTVECIFFYDGQFFRQA